MSQEYCDELVHKCRPLLFQGFKAIFDNCQKKNRKKKYLLREFQEILESIPLWNTNIVQSEYNRFKITSQCEWFDNLIIASYATIAKSITGENENINLPICYEFIHKCYINIAREFWKKPYLLYSHCEAKENIKNTNIINNIISSQIIETIKKDLPIENMIDNFIEKNLKHQDIKDNPDNTIQQDTPINRNNDNNGLLNTRDNEDDKTYINHSEDGLLNTNDNDDGILNTPDNDNDDDDKTDIIDNSEDGILNTPDNDNDDDKTDIIDNSEDDGILNTHNNDDGVCDDTAVGGNYDKNEISDNDDNSVCDDDEIKEVNINVKNSSIHQDFKEIQTITPSLHDNVEEVRQIKEYYDTSIEDFVPQIIEESGTVSDDMEDFVPQIIEEESDTVSDDIEESDTVLDSIEDVVPQIIEGDREIEDLEGTKDETQTMITATTNDDSSDILGENKKEMDIANNTTSTLKLQSDLGVVTHGNKSKFSFDKIKDILGVQIMNKDFKDPEIKKKLKRYLLLKSS